jgi:hypothetical protein
MVDMLLCPGNVSSGFVGVLAGFAVEELLLR